MVGNLGMRFCLKAVRRKTYRRQIRIASERHLKSNETSLSVARYHRREPSGLYCCSGMQILRAHMHLIL